MDMGGARCDDDRGSGEAGAIASGDDDGGGVAEAGSDFAGEFGRADGLATVSDLDGYLRPVLNGAFHSVAGRDYKFLKSGLEGGVSHWRRS